MIALACVYQNMKAWTHDINISPILEVGHGQNKEQLVQKSIKWLIIGIYFHDTDV